MTISLMLVWDYDTPTGFDASAGLRDADPMSEYTTTDRILELFAEYEIVCTFACVGVSAESGPLPYHNPSQIRQIHEMGHEVASHTHRHELIPTLNKAQLRETLTTSKKALEDCIGAPVVGLVPPWNRPFHHPHKGSISLKDLKAGGYWWKQSVNSLCKVLGECGYEWVRVLYGNRSEQAQWQQQGFGSNPIRSFSAEKRHNVWALRHSYLGYDQRFTDWVETLSGDQTIVFYGHPHGIEHENTQHWRHLTHFAQWYAENKARLGLQTTTPREWIRQPKMSLK